MGYIVRNKKSCGFFLGILVVLSLVVPGGVLTAFADEAVSVRNSFQAGTEQTQYTSDAQDQMVDGTKADFLSDVATDQDFSNNLLTPVVFMSASPTPKAVDVDITDFKIQNLDK